MVKISSSGTVLSSKSCLSTVYGCPQVAITRAKEIMGLFSLLKLRRQVDFRKPKNLRVTKVLVDTYK